MDRPAPFYKGQLITLAGRRKTRHTTIGKIYPVIGRKRGLASEVSVIMDDSGKHLEITYYVAEHWKVVEEENNEGVLFLLKEDF